ncbi:L-threonylcarbamoyladenylate synthase [Patescibacteria group bacterium]
MERIFLENNKDLAHKQALDVLKKGNAVVVPTDTVYGLAVDALNENAVNNLIKIKNRPINKQIPVFINDISMLEKIAVLDRRFFQFLEKFWPGALTVILPAQNTISQAITGDLNTIGVRIPDYQWLLDLIKDFNRPITSTSANISGDNEMIDPRNITDIFAKMSVRPDLIIDAGILPESMPSTVVDLTKKPYRILREGAIKKHDIEQAFSYAQG